MLNPTLPFCFNAYVFKKVYVGEIKSFVPPEIEQVDNQRD
jgi:hypothetical protein